MVAMVKNYSHKMFNYSIAMSLSFEKKMVGRPTLC